MSKYRLKAKPLQVLDVLGRQQRATGEAEALRGEVRQDRGGGRYMGLLEVQRLIKQLSRIPLSVS